jgi:hypothetical protein
MRALPECVESGLPPILDLADVMRRYGLHDSRAARSVMDSARGFVVIGRCKVQLAAPLIEVRR